MTVWNYSVSWSKFKLALDCPKQLKYTIDKTQPSYFSDNYYLTLGKAVQFVFEMYFNQKINLKEGGRSTKVINKAVDKIQASAWLNKQEVLYPKGKDHGTFWEEARKGVNRGYEIFEETGLIGKDIRAEVKWNATFRNFRMFAMIDFLVETRDGFYLYDGKGHVEKNADVRQLLYYSLAVSTNKPVLGGGFLYWQHGYEPLDLSAKARKEFADTDFERGRKIFKELITGTEDLPPTPGKICYFCNWRNTCTASPHRNPEADHTTIGEVDLGA